MSTLKNSGRQLEAPSEKFQLRVIDYARVLIERHFKPEVIDTPCRHATHLDEPDGFQALPKLETHFNALGFGLGARDAGFELPDEFIYISLLPGIGGQILLRKRCGRSPWIGSSEN